ncbi:MAG: aspartate--tRNA ligase [Alphaproteobacteria bacterium]|nr:aspartate--tRNA ligase [Alphaproteobacteria bacterium]MCL2889958.1 aspartate--tRNA ligase [Alphaproteobacteria bacterium]
MQSNIYRSHTCGELTAANVGASVTLSGWVHRKRDHGGLLFIDLRDNYGITQVVVDITKPELAGVEKIRPESVITVSGSVVARDSAVINAKIPTGEIEVVAVAIKILAESEVLPFQVFGDEESNEELRLKYRYLDLRRERMHHNILFRNRVIKSMRDKMWDMGFSEFQTPILGATSPEGARDFIVPSRLHHGHVYALPQSPQQWKQLIQYSGFDRYFQIAPCFRDEDLRSDRLLEFYQLDLEMSFVEQEDVMGVCENLLVGLVTEFAPTAKLHADIPRITYDDAMLKYGSDKPDLRIPIEIVDVSDIFRDSDFTIFADAVKSGAVVRAIPAPGSSDKPRSWFDKTEEFAKTELGLAGLGYIVFGIETKGPIAKKLTAGQVESIRVRCGVSVGDSIFFVCEQPGIAAKAAGKLRKRFGEEIGLDPKEFKICWVVDFPFFEADEESEKGIMFGHNPFGRPQGDLQNLDLSEPLKLKAAQYDMVMNGEEVGGGGLRNYDPAAMLKLFEAVGYGEDVVREKFGGMYTAFQYGAVPTGGLAMGVERIVCLLLDEPNLREITAFPTNQRGQDLMMGSPNTPFEKQLREAHIQFRKKN